MTAAVSTKTSSAAGEVGSAAPESSFCHSSSSSLQRWTSAVGRASPDSTSSHVSLSKRRTSSSSVTVMPASTISPWASTVPATVAELVRFTRLMATAMPTAALPPSAAEPSAIAVPSVLAEERTVTAPPEVTVTPTGIDASEFEVARLIAIAAPTAIGPEDDSADGVAVAPESEPPLSEAWPSAAERSPAI